MEQQFTKASFVRSYVVPALLMFVIPTAGYAFSTYAQRSLDKRFLEQVSSVLSSAQELSSAQKREFTAYFRAHTASEMCATGDEALPPGYRDQACGRHAQFRWIGATSYA